MLLENFLKLGAPDEVVFTDLINSHMCGQMTFQVVGNTGGKTSASLLLLVALGASVFKSFFGRTTGLE